MASIRMCSLLDSCNWNQDTFNPNIGFHILPEFGPLGGYFHHLSSEIKGSKFHSVEMTRDPIGFAFEATLTFQKSYAKAIC